MRRFKALKQDLVSVTCYQYRGQKVEKVKEGVGVLYVLIVLMTTGGVQAQQKGRTVGVTQFEICCACIHVLALCGHSEPRLSSMLASVTELKEQN